MDPYQDDHLQAAETSTRHAHLPNIFIKSEPFLEDLREVLDELGEILDEEYAEKDREENQTTSKADEKLDESKLDVNPDEFDLDDKLRATPPPPFVLLADDSLLFTRRLKTYCDTSPLSFNESPQESGEISSSEAEFIEETVYRHEEPFRSKNSPLRECLEHHKNIIKENPERCWTSKKGASRESSLTKSKGFKPDRTNRRSKSKECSRVRRTSFSVYGPTISRSSSPKFRTGRTSSSRNSMKKSTSSPQRHQSQSGNHKRRRNSKDDRIKRRRSPSPRRSCRSRSRSWRRRSRSRTAINSCSDRRSKEENGSRRRRSSPFRCRLRSPCSRRNYLRRLSPERKHRNRSRSRSRNPGRHRLESKVRLRERSRSRSKPIRNPFLKRSRSRSKSPKAVLRGCSRSISKPRSESKDRLTKVRQRSRRLSNRSGSRVRENSISGSQPAKSQSAMPLLSERFGKCQGSQSVKNSTVKSLEDKSKTPIPSALPAEAMVAQVRIQQSPSRTSNISPIRTRPISPLVTLHDNRISRPQELREWFLPTPNAPQMLCTQMHFEQVNYTQHYNFPHVPCVPQLNPFDLRRRLATKRSVIYLGPNDLRHRIQEVFQPEIYAPPIEFSAYAEWSSGFPGQYQHSGYY
ncbi:serine/arginine repetitive matrix protein 2 [Drosophila ficusphila]|uniref:serine/arginine repetitive matrix protein 2 n=1 Tax=Drosophila ficusphila TaxID=30025 RepID=UPI0007E7B8D9|nr:serine/arginine repetitive matrix protein 2 [Drosophila ficusphila]XP_017042267.1 serine/arginine repetitive matrix protein 2 [Drosophila ficusphila]